MGLQALPRDFGIQSPNLRVLNLNYNALKDLRPLLGILRLQKLRLAGNRISRLRRTAAVFERLGKELVDADLRNNTLTVGFYTPQAAASEPVILEKQLTVPSSHRFSSNSFDDPADPDLSLLHILPAASKFADAAARERLDEDTKLRRRVYEMLVVSGCKQLRVLDGLEVDREEVGRRDGIWERLREVGVLRLKGDGNKEGEKLHGRDGRDDCKEGIE